MKRALPLLATLALAACSSGTAGPDTTTPGDSVPATDSTVASSTTTAGGAATSVPATTASGTEAALRLAAINGATLAVIELNSALLTKAGHTAAAAAPAPSSSAPVSSIAPVKRSTREAAVLLAALASNPPKGYSLVAYGSMGVTKVFDGSSLVAKDLAGLVEYLELSHKGASVCLRPSIDGTRDAAQSPVDADRYRAIPIGKLVQPAGDAGWVVLLRTQEAGACRLALDTLALP